MKKYLLILSAVFVIAAVANSCNQPAPEIAATGANDTAANSAKFQLQLITDEVPSPVTMAVTGDGSNRLFICEKEGKVWIIQNGKMLSQPFIDVRNQMVAVDKGYDERGLLGMAFHPDFKNNRKFYIYYSAPSQVKGSDHKSIIAEYKVSAVNANLADMSSKRVIMEIEEPESNHNGGNMTFGADGYLYVGLGDGGGGGDRHGSNGNGQNLDILLGKIIRIDVNGNPYNVPKDNPFINTKNARPEIWAYGLRNPWRFSFDRETNELYAGDVGQNKYEEIDIIKKGGNYGWRIMEGYHDFNVPRGADTSHLVHPVYEYDHDRGISIIGGYIYRGKALPELSGKYVYGDYNGKMWLLTKKGETWTNSDLEISNKPRENMQILSWGQDEEGELYLLVTLSTSNGFKGSVYKFARK